MNPHTMAALIGQGLVLNAMVAELVGFLTPEQRALLRARLQEHAQDIGPIDEFEPDCSEYQRKQYAEWFEVLAPKP